MNVYRFPGHELTFWVAPSDEDVALDTRFGGPDYGLPDAATLGAIHRGGVPALNAYSFLFRNG
jgi:hypothetical protein